MTVEADTKSKFELNYLESKKRTFFAPVRNKSDGQAEELQYGLTDAGAKLVFCDQQRLAYIATALSDLSIEAIVVRPEGDNAGVAQDWEELLRSSLSLLRPGGQFLIMDVFSERWNPMKPFVELLARADLRRDVAGALAASTQDFEREPFGDASPWVFGGTLFVAHGKRAE